MKNATKVLLLFLLFSVIITLASGAYTVTPYSPPTGPYDASGADANISFFQLPLWVQASWIIGIVLAGLGAIKFGPLVLAGSKSC